MKIKCKCCGKYFEHHNYCKKYCGPECAETARKKRNHQYWENEKEQRKKKKKEPNLPEINRLAREAGMTYGKYVAMKYIEEQRNASTVQGLQR